MPYTDTGRLTVRTYTAGGALPVPSVVIRVRGVDENNRYISYSILTDIDGVTSISSLPAPDKALSLSPGAIDAPYATYDIEASADGYYTKNISSVAIFSGENAVLPINMIPLSLDNGGSTYPRGSLDTQVYENELLEM